MRSALQRFELQRYKNWLVFSLIFYVVVKRFIEFDRRNWKPRRDSRITTRLVELWTHYDFLTCFCHLELFCPHAFTARQIITRSVLFIVTLFPILTYDMFFFKTINTALFFLAVSWKEFAFVKRIFISFK